MPQRRLGAYVLPGDTVWLEKTLTRTYPLLDALVVPVPADGVGWNGHPIPVEAALAIIRRVDTRGILSIVDGRWVEPTEPMRGETAQRQAAIDALAGTVDWVLQLDGDRSSLQIARPAEAGEHRWEGLRHEEAVIHNSWARSPHEIRQKVRSWGHANDVGGGRYYWLRWYPSPVTWRYARNLHPFARGLWPRLSRTAPTGELD